MDYNRSQYFSMSLNLLTSTKDKSDKSTLLTLTQLLGCKRKTYQVVTKLKHCVGSGSAVSLLFVDVTTFANRLVIVEQKLDLHLATRYLEPLRHFNTGNL